MSAGEDGAAPPQEVTAAPILRVLNADATPEEVAAIVAVFSALGGSDAPAPKTPAPAWAANYRRLRPQHPHGPGGWRASGLPRP